MGLGRRRFLTTAGLALGGAWLGCEAGGRSAAPAHRSTEVATSDTNEAVPAIFVAHGAPTLALDATKGADFAAWGRALPRPRAILCVSAHWERAPVSIGTVERRPLMYDFGGFPRPLYEVQYDAPGASDLADRVVDLLGPETQRRPERALDHGVWVPLVHMVPEADVPVLQLSLPSRWTPRQLFELGRRLAPLRREGILVMGSGNLTHNLRAVGRDGAPPPAWAAEFDQWITEVLEARDVDQLLAYRERAPALRQNHPTEEHLQPLLVTAGAAADGRGDVSFPVSGWEYASLTRRSVQLA